MSKVPFSGNASYNLDLDAALVSQNTAQNFSTIYWRAIVNKTGSTSYWASGGGNTGWADSSVNSDLWNGRNLAYDFRNASNKIFAEGTFNVPHRADGTAEYWVKGGLTLASLGSATAETGTRSLPRIANVPEAPTPLPFGEITASSIQYRFSGNGSGGGPIRQWQVHYGTDPNAGQLAANSDGGTPITGLLPGRTYYFWSRGRNDLGWGPFSKRTSAKTLAGGARIKVNGAWKVGVPYIKVNGTWKLAVPYIKVNGVWKPAN